MATDQFVQNSIGKVPKGAVGRDVLKRPSTLKLSWEPFHFSDK